jgi:hypothetical protein
MTILYIWIFTGYAQAIEVNDVFFAEQHPLEEIEL